MNSKTELKEFLFKKRNINEKTATIEDDLILVSMDTCYLLNTVFCLPLFLASSGSTSSDFSAFIRDGGKRQRATNGKSSSTRISVVFIAYFC